MTVTDRPATARTAGDPAPSTTPPVPSTMPPALPGAHAAPVLAVVAGGAVATVALWWRNTPSIHGFGDWLTNAGRITGLLAGYGVVALVALMARIPPLERGIGADRLARWHARGGRYTVSLVAAHGLLIIWGYAVTAHTDVVSQTSSLLVSYPDVLMATVAGLLLVGVGLVSARAARRRMSYETWYYLHFYTYVAVALAFSHQFANGAEFVNNRAARVMWSAMYLGVGAAILWYRFVVPVRQAVRHRMRVEAVYQESPGVVSVVVGGRQLGELGAQSGQFFRWRFLTRELWWASNPYSLSAAPFPDGLRITVKAFGQHSAALAGLYRAGGDVDVVFRHELTAIARQRGARLHFVTGRRAQLGYDPLGVAALTTSFPDLRTRDVFVCGPDGMTASVVAALREAKVPRRQIHHETFEF